MSPFIEIKNTEMYTGAPTHVQMYMPGTSTTLGAFLGVSKGQPNEIASEQVLISLGKACSMFAYKLITAVVNTAYTISYTVLPHAVAMVTPTFLWFCIPKA